MMLNLKTMMQEIDAVKQFGERVFIPIEIDGEYDCTNDLLHPITDAPDKAEYTESNYML